MLLAGHAIFKVRLETSIKGSNPSDTGKFADDLCLGFGRLKTQQILGYDIQNSYIQPCRLQPGKIPKVRQKTSSFRAGYLMCSVNNLLNSSKTVVEPNPLISLHSFIAIKPTYTRLKNHI